MEWYVNAYDECDKYWCANANGVQMYPSAQSGTSFTHIRNKLKG
jgi:hypothetical protein